MAFQPNCCHAGLVAFTVKLQIADSYPKHSGVLKFANVLINQGGAYSTDTGKFTCPLGGIYHFAVHASVYGRGQCAIYKNGESIVSVYDTSLPQKCSQVSSTGTVLQLVKDDTVWVNVDGESTNDIFATASNDTVFLGFRLA